MANKEPNRIRPGIRVLIKNFNNQSAMVISGPPIVLGNPHRPSGAFPLEVHDHVIIRVKIKGQYYICLEPLDNLTVASSKKPKKT